MFQSNSVIGFAGAEVPEEKLVISKEAVLESNRVSKMAIAALLLVSETGCCPLF